MTHRVLRYAVGALLLVAGIAGGSSADLVVGPGYAESYSVYELGSRYGSYVQFQWITLDHLSDGVFDDTRFGPGGFIVVADSYGSLQGLGESGLHGPPSTKELGFELRNSSFTSTRDVGGYVSAGNYMVIETSFQVTSTQLYDVSASLSAATSATGESSRSEANARIRILGGSSGVPVADFSATPDMMISATSRVLLVEGYTYSLYARINTSSDAGSSGSGENELTAGGASSARFRLSVVPEPAGLTTLSLGGLTLLAYSRRRRAGAA